jgi:hypothetical protein
MRNHIELVRNFLRGDLHHDDKLVQPILIKRGQLELGIHDHVLAVDVGILG